MSQLSQLNVLTVFFRRGQCGYSPGRMDAQKVSMRFSDFYINIPLCTSDIITAVVVVDSHIQRIVLVCVCVFFPFILDIKFVGRTSRGHTGGRSHRISHPPSFCGACLDFCREKDSAIPFPRRP